MTLSELLLPHEERGVALLLAADRSQRIAATAARLERRAAEIATQRHHGVPDAAEAALDVVKAWVRATSSTRAPTRLGRDWMEFLVDQCEQGPLGRATLDELFRALEDEVATDLTDPDRAWLLAQRVATLRFLDEHGDRTTGAHSAGHLARIVATGVQGVTTALGMEAPPADELASALETAVGRWVASTRRLDSDGARFVTLDLLYRELLLRFPGTSVACWHFVWTRLDQELGERMGRAPHGWTTALEAVERATEAYAALEAWPEVAREQGVADSLVGLVGTLTLLQAARGDTARLARSLDLAALIARSQGIDFDDLAHTTNERLRGHLERHQIDPLVDGILRVGRLVAGAHARVRAEDHVADVTRAAASNLAEGLQGSNAADRMDGLLRAIVGAAVRATSWTDDARARRRHFRAILALELGAGRRPEWHRYREFTPLLQRALNDHPDAEPLLQLVAQLPACVAAARDTQLGWAAGRIESIARREAGAGAEALTDATRLLAVGLRIVSPVEAASWMVDAWLDTLPDAAQLDPRAVRRAFADLEALARTGANEPVQEALSALSAVLPGVLAGCVLPGLGFRIATLASDTTFDTLPAYGSDLGEVGHAACVRDNGLTLATLARILRARTPDPAGALWTWWSASVDTYITSRPPGLFEANLRGLLHGLDTLLGDAEATVCAQVLTAMYRDGLAVELGTDQDARSVLPRTYPAVGARWTALFGPLSTPDVVQRLPAARATALAAAAELEALGQPLRAYLSQVRATSDPEFAAAASLRALADVLDRHPPDLVFDALDALVDHGPPASDAGARAWWTALLAPFVRAAEDALLGRTLATHASPIAAAVASRLAGDGPDAQARCARDQGLVLSFLGRQLGRSPTAHVALEVGRYLAMGVAPFVGYDATTWRRVWAEVGRALAPHLPAPGRAAWARWQAQLDGLADLLPELGPLGREILHAEDVVLAEQRDEDQRWRELVCSLVVAVGTPGDAPVPTAHLLQRLCLIDPVLAELDASSWPERSEALVDFLSGYLPAVFHGRVRAVCSQVHVELLNHDRLADTGHRTLSAWVAGCSAHPAARALWLGDMLCRLPTTGALRTPEDLVVGQLTGWSLPDPADLRQGLITLDAAEAFETRIAPREARKGLLSWFSRGLPAPSDDDQQALRAWIRAIARGEALGRPDATRDTFRLASRLGHPECLEPLLAGLCDTVPDALRTVATRASAAAPRASLGHALASGALDLPGWAASDGSLPDTVRLDLDDLARTWTARCAGWVASERPRPPHDPATAPWLRRLVGSDPLRQALPSVGAREAFQALVDDEASADPATRGATA